MKLPRKKEHERLGARHLNKLSEAAEQILSQPKPRVQQSEFIQRWFQISALGCDDDVRDDIYTIVPKYYDSMDQTWKVDGSGGSFCLDDIQVATGYDIGDDLQAYWDAQRNAFIPLAAAGQTEACPCVCIEEGDIVANGTETTSVWAVTMGDEEFPQEFGSIFFPGGVYQLVWDEGDEEWQLDIGDLLTAEYLSGNDATADTTMDGTLIMSLDGYGVPQIQLCVDGEVPEE